MKKERDTYNATCINVCLLLRNRTRTLSVSREEFAGATSLVVPANELSA